MDCNQRPSIPSPELQLPRLLYAAPAWWGLTTAEDRLRLERFHNKMQRLGFLPPDIMSADALVRDIEGRLLRAVM